jgi:type III pantothenate kinase
LSYPLSGLISEKCTLNAGFPPWCWSPLYPKSPNICPRIWIDRLCNVAAAAAAGLGSALIVDAGTATTFDILLDGSFIGGMIAPGMASAAAGLATQTARLDPVPFGPAAWTAGNDTESAMRAGAWHTGVGGIRHTVKGLVDRYGPLPVILTGGLGVHLVDAGWYFDPHWTLRGAAILSKV